MAKEKFKRKRQSMPYESSSVGGEAGRLIKKSTVHDPEAKARVEASEKQRADRRKAGTVHVVKKKTGREVEAVGGIEPQKAEGVNGIEPQKAEGQIDIKGFLEKAYTHIRSTPEQRKELINFARSPAGQAILLPLTSGLHEVTQSAGSKMLTGASANKKLLTTSVSSDYVRQLEMQGEQLIASAGLSAPKVAKAAAGRLVSSRIVKKTTLGGGKTLINVYDTGKGISWLSKLVKFAKKPSSVLGLISTTAGFWGLGEWGEAEGLEGLQFQYRKAVDDGEDELAKEINEVYEDASNPALWKTILSVIPILQLPITAEKVGIKLKAAAAMKKVTDAQIRRTEEGILTPDEQYWANVRANK